MTIKLLACVLAATVALLAGCAGAPQRAAESPIATETIPETTQENAHETTPPAAVYHHMPQDEAKALMDEGTACILLDVRSQAEFDQQHITGAILIPLDELRTRADNELPDKDALIMVYCRSGVRSKNAAETLVEMGYTGVYDIGGIITWEYGVTP